MKKNKRGKLVKKTGLPPGALVYTGDKNIEFTIQIIEYDSEHYREYTINDISQLDVKNATGVTWINIIGLHDIEAVEKIGNYFGLNKLVLEDILNVYQRPKIEYYDENIFVVLKMLSLNNETKVLDAEQVSIVFGKNYVISFQEKEIDIFGFIRSRLKNNKGIIRKKGSDYLVYALIDVIVDNYFVVLEQVEEELENLEDEVTTKTGSDIVERMHKMKKDLIVLRKAVWPLTELVGILYKEKNKLIAEETLMYFRDVYDHTIQIIDILDTIRDILSGLLDIYLSEINTKTNEVMKMLTLIATIFILLTFLVGVYGMNFKNMPELEWKYGYFGLWGIMIFIGVGLTLYFKKKKWM
ncbi:MAG: magnesium transporter [Deferribacteres bacterium]|jgi:magnesium transporter|nr:magnesium transporter [Deferribacteres bacterium]